LTRSENLRIRDLLGPIRGHLVLKGLGYFLLIAPASAAGSFFASLLVYRSWQPPMPAGILGARHLPLAAVLYSIFLWPLLWSITEELTYNGYLALRLLALSKNPTIAFGLAGFWWIGQHLFLPLILNWQFLLWRFLAFVPGVFALLLLYCKTRNLPPIVFAHWILDVIAAVTTISFHFG
jgi:membrane protease YdiL (CAAX protease family)